MPDYGHPLLFGSFITPTNGPARQPVELAVLAEDLGFDLVTFQDHPYQPAFHDTWTLLAWVAARTERVHVSGNVLNLPLRSPAVLARAAASLDLLSGGRFDLGLGAGGFWDGVAAMGGRRLTSGQAVDALSEGIDVIRSVWGQGDRPRFDVDGEYYRVSGTMRGPAPAHNIPIWLGAYKPRMLRPTGRKADGWLPSSRTSSLASCGTLTGSSTLRPKKRAATPGRSAACSTSVGSSRQRDEGCSTARPSSGSRICCRWRSRTASARSSSPATTPRQYAGSRPR